MLFRSRSQKQNKPRGGYTPGPRPSVDLSTMDAAQEHNHRVARAENEVSLHTGSSSSSSSSFEFEFELGTAG